MLGNTDMLVATSGEREFTISRSLATDLNRLAENVKSEAIEQGDTFDANDDVSKAMDKFNAETMEARMDFVRQNGDDLSAPTADFFRDIEKVSQNAQRRSLEGPGSTETLYDVANAFTALFNPLLDGADASKAQSATQASKSADASESFEDLLEGAKGETTSKGMSEMLSKAIAALIAELLGENESSAAPTSPGKPAAPTTPVATAAPKAPPAPPVEQRLSGDALASQMDANGKGLTINGDGSLGIRSGKKDRNKDEIRGDQVMTFKPRMNMGDEKAVERFDSATVEVSKLYGDKGGKRQEKGFVDVIDNGKVVDRIEIRGDGDGKQAVEITQPFTELKFSTAGGKDDFAVSSITVRKGGDASEGAESTAPSAVNDTPEASDAGGDVSDNLVELLRALEEAMRLLEESQNANSGLDPSADDEDAIPPMLQAIMKILSAIQAARGANTPGGKDITSKELAEIMQAVEELMEPFQNSNVDDAEKKKTYSNIMTAMEAIEDMAA